MNEQTGYALGYVVGKLDDHSLLCPVNRDIVRIVNHPTELVLQCDLPDGHDGYHWDRSAELQWRSKSVQREAWLEARVVPPPDVFA